MMAAKVYQPDQELETRVKKGKYIVFKSNESTKILNLVKSNYIFRLNYNFFSNRKNIRKYAHSCQ